MGLDKRPVKRYFKNMDNVAISISQLKANPSKAIFKADDYPMVIESRGKAKGYLLGKVLFEKIIAYFEDCLDQKAIKETNFKKGKDFETVAQKLGI